MPSEPTTEEERKLLNVALAIGDVLCEVTKSSVEDYDSREITVKLSEDGFEEYIRELRSNRPATKPESG